MAMYRVSSHRVQGCRLCSGLLSPAIVLGDEGNHFAVHDGAHRLDAARAAGLATVEAYIGKRHASIA